MFRSLLLISSALAPVVAGSALADDYGSANQGQVTIQQAASMMAYSAGNDQAQVSIAPNWSEELGWSVRAAAGRYLSDAVALGTIVEYGQDKQEYLGNIGFQLSNSLSLIGTMGRLAEHKEFVSGEGEDKATQMEYGLSLKLARQEGQGFELNGYAVDAKASNDSIETGKLFGTEALVSLGLSDTTFVKIAGGYEWLEWDNREKDNHWTFRTEANHKLTDMFRLQGHVKLGASERSYGGGLNLGLSSDGRSILGINYTQIEGLHGIGDDKRVELSWNHGFGAGLLSSVAAMGPSDKGGTNWTDAHVAAVTSPKNLLDKVVKRPSHLPERLLARVSNSSACDAFTISNVGLAAYYPFIRIEPSIAEPIDNDFDLEIREVRVYVDETLASNYTISTLSFSDSNSELLMWAILAPLFASGSILRVDIDMNDGRCYESNEYTVPPPP